MRQRNAKLKLMNRQQLQNVKMQSSPHTSLLQRRDSDPPHVSYTTKNPLWCRRGRSKKGKRNQQFKLLSIEDAWDRFKNHTIFIGEQEVGQRLDALIAAIPDAQIAFGMEIRYYHDCWMKYINYKKGLSDPESIHLQGVCLKESQTIFLKFVKQVAFEDHKIPRVLNELIYSKAISFYKSVTRSKRKNFETQIVETIGGELATKKVQDMERL